MVGLEVVEKLFWTAFDFLALRPKKFRAALEANPNRYLDPVTFAVATFVLYQVSLVAVVRTISPLVDWDRVLGLAMKLPAVRDATTLLAVSASYAIFSYLAFAFVMVIGARLTGRRLRMRDALIGMCYACATFLPIVAYMGVAAFIVVVEGSLGFDPTSKARLMHVGFYLLNVFLLAYFIGGASAFGNISFLRLLLGCFFAMVLMFLVLIALKVTVGPFLR